MDVYTTSQVGRSRERTPEGFLLCRDVPLARTGEMLYAEHEVPVPAGPDGIVRITRDAAEVFSARTIASFQGKPITDNHPDEVVTPENYRRVVGGVVLNPRRGTDDLADYLVADFLIQDAATIFAVESGKRQVSAGYDADYNTVAPGRGSQHNIIANHVALVDKGRCGTTCAIGDQAPMTTQAPAPAAQPSFMDKLTQGMVAALTGQKPTTDCAGVPAAAPAVVAPPAPTATFDMAAFATTIGAALAAAVEPTNAKLDALAAAVAKGATKDGETEGEEEDDKDKGTKDSALAAEFAQIKVRGEILTPGFTIPTMDAATTADTLTGHKRRALDAAFKTDAGRDAILPFIGGNKSPNFTTMGVATVDAAFIGASELIKARNNGTAGSALETTRTTRDFGKGPATPAEFNATARDYWAKHTPHVQK